MATFYLAPGGIADFTNNFRIGMAIPGSAGLNPLKTAGHLARGNAFLSAELDFSIPDRKVDVLRRASPVIAVGDILTMLVIPQRSHWASTCVAVDVAIPGLAFDVRVADDDATGPVLRYAQTNNNLVTTTNAPAGSLVAPGVDTAGTAYTVVAGYNAGVVGFTQFATPLANAPVNEQAFLQFVITAVPTTPLLSATVRGKILVGVGVQMSMFQTID